MSKRWMRMGAGLAPAVLLAGLLSAAPLSASPAVGAGRLQPVVGPTEPAFQRTDSVLSPRLSQLTDPCHAGPFAGRAGHRRSGSRPAVPGSLLAGDQGYIVIIGVADMSDATQQALTRAGATIGAIDPAQTRIEASVPADKLVAVGSVCRRAVGARGAHPSHRRPVRNSDLRRLGGDRRGRRPATRS